MSRGSNFTNYGKPPKEKKPKAGVKLIQPILIEWELAKILVEAKAMKAPVVPKMEPMEKWVLARGWDLAIEHDKSIGLTVATIVCPGIDEPLTFTGMDATMALATAKAIGEAYTKGPKQSSFLGHSIDDADRTPAQPMKGQTSFVTDEPASVNVENMAGEVLETVKILLAEEATAAPPDDWRFLFIVDPADSALWNYELPVVGYGDIEEKDYVVVFDDGTGDADRGWYLDPDFDYDHKTGTITDKDTRGVVWSRDTASKPAESDPAVDFIMGGMKDSFPPADRSANKPRGKPKVSNTTAEQADALNAAGIAPEPF